VIGGKRVMIKSKEYKQRDNSYGKNNETARRLKRGV
jgi:hypothetical protein